MSRVATIMDPDDNKVKEDWFCLKKIVLDTIRGDQSLYILLEVGYKYNSNCYNVSFSILRSPFSQGIFSILYYLPLSSLTSTCRSDCWCWSLSCQHLPEVFG